jgi:hypothetical protein
MKLLNKTKKNNEAEKELYQGGRQVRKTTTVEQI